MNEPQKIPLTNNPRSKQPNLIRLEPSLDNDLKNDLWTQNENNYKNNSQSIQPLESDEVD